MTLRTPRSYPGEALDNGNAGPPRIEGYSRQVLMCVGPRCAPPGVAQAVYDRLKDLQRTRGLEEGPGQIRRAKCHCLHVCEGGPILVVHPDGVWYSGVTTDVMEEIFEEHIVGGRPVARHVMHRQALAREGT